MSASLSPSRLRLMAAELIALADERDVPMLIAPDQIGDCDNGSPSKSEPMPLHEAAKTLGIMNVETLRKQVKRKRLDIYVNGRLHINRSSLPLVYSRKKKSNV